MIAMMIISNQLIILYDPMLILNRTYEQFYNELEETITMPNISSVHIFIQTPESMIVRPVYCDGFGDSVEFVTVIERLIRQYSDFKQRRISVTVHFPKTIKKTPVMNEIQKYKVKNTLKAKFIMEDYVVFKMGFGAYMIIGFMDTIFGKRIVVQKHDKPEISTCARTGIVVPYYGIFHGDLDMIEEVGDDYDMMFCYYTK